MEKEALEYSTQINALNHRIEELEAVIRSIPVNIFWNDLQHVIRGTNMQGVPVGKTACELMKSSSGKQIETTDNLCHKGTNHSPN